MDLTENHPLSYDRYGELWNHNLQKIEDLQADIHRCLNELEALFAAFDPSYRQMSELVDTLSSIYANFNSLGGAEYVLKLRAVVEHYRKRSTRESVDFELLTYLIDRIKEERDRAFRDFPALTHDSRPEAAPQVPDETRFSCRWITFFRNGSWFLSGYRSLEIVELGNAGIEFPDGPGLLEISLGAKKIRVTDLLASHTANLAPPAFAILLGKGENGFAATRIGKRIYSKKDFIAQKITPLENAPCHPLFAGRVRLFGRNHLVLAQNHS